jgi:hypothetical protein
MARGWESKSVEAQQDAAAARRRTSATAPGSAQPTGQRATLHLARTKALGDLQRACAGPHRAMLEQAIADLDARLQALDREEV